MLQASYIHQETAPGVHHCVTSQIYPSGNRLRGLSLCYKSVIPIRHLLQGSIIVLQVIYTHQTSAPGVYHCVTSRLYPSAICPRGLTLCYKSVIPISPRNLSLCYKSFIPIRHLPQGSIIVLQVIYTHQASAPGVYHCVTSQLYPSGICLQGIITTYSPPFSSADDQYNH